jgi:hypothetical protein
MEQLLLDSPREQSMCATLQMPGIPVQQPKESISKSSQLLYMTDFQTFDIFVFNNH